jgi:hypothetical protein
MIDERGGHAWPPVETGGFKMIDEILSQYLLLIFYQTPVVYSSGT